jgi:hypothetical protein
LHSNKENKPSKISVDLTARSKKDECSGGGPKLVKKKSSNFKRLLSEIV